MFTGIVERVGRIVAMQSSDAGRRLAIHADDFWNDVPIGGSIAVDGTCLTIAAKSAAQAEFDVVAETIGRTTLGTQGVGGSVNLEKSMRADGRLDGHFVQGHVEGVSRVCRIDRGIGESKWWFETPAALRAYILPKGSVCIDGISLTVVDATEATFSVVLIPTTLRVTTLGHKQPGHKVNIETDMLVRAVVRTIDAMLAGRESSDGPRRPFSHAE